MGNFECSECGATFDTAEDLAQHIKDDHAGGEEATGFQCKQCGEQFETKEELEEHIDDVHTSD